jgi:NAD(P)-dependent dehydrogenase (short-subunit alcohol dehydrogenase family)
MTIPVFPETKVALKGRKGLIVGIANDQSIAWGCAKAFRALGAELAVTYLNERAKKHVEPLAKALDIPLDAHALIRLRNTSAQTGLDAKARRRNLHEAFAVRADAELPAHVAILDDVMTTGTTLRECARVLLRSGVKRVDVWALARAPARGSR